MKSYRMILGFAAVLLLIGLACGGSTTPPTNTPAPTIPPNPTQVPAPTGSPSAPEQPASGFELDSSGYSHKSNLFEFNPPKGWKITESDFDVWIESPEDGSSGIYAALTNTGYELDPESFNSFVTYMETTYYNWHEDFTETDRREDADERFIIIEKTYTDADLGKRQAMSIYDQEGASVFTLELIGSEDFFTENIDSFDQLISDVTINGSEAASLPLYQLTWTFSGPEGAFTMNVPSAFSYFYDDTTYNNAVIESFWSPDGLALVENISLIDGGTYTIGNAGIATQQLLNERYTSGGGDIKVSKVETLSDGSELWTWTSRKGGYSGFTNLEVRNGKQILILSFVSSNDTQELYNPVFQTVLSSYTIP